MCLRIGWVPDILRHVAAWVALAVVIALFAWLRLAWIQEAVVTQRCLAGAGTLVCDIRTCAVAASNGAVTIAALTLGALALCWRHPLVAWLTAASGGIAMVLYHAEPGAAALLIGVLRLARCHADAHTKAQCYR